jgi:bifunctional DNase/RNase
MMTKMTVEGIGIDQQNNPLVLLCDDEHKTFVPIWIGPAEAMSIQMELDNRQPPRPFTHDLIANILREMDVRLVKVTVTDFEKQVYYATLHLESRHNHDESPQQIDARPSDAIALALRAQCQIWVSDEVIEKTGIQRDEVLTDEALEDTSELPSRVEDVAPEASPEEINKFVQLLEGVDFGDEGDTLKN